MSIDYTRNIGKKINNDDFEIILTNYIASGGNSVVYECKYNDGDYVIKFFVGKSKRYKRFQSEIEKINYLNERLDNYTPKVILSFTPDYDYKTTPYLNVHSSPFYIMEKGDKFIYNSLRFEEKIVLLIEICESLIQMHTLNVRHRDIKPENIVKYNTHLTFIDYGTSCVPSVKTIDDRENMGSRGTMAPEMYNHAYGIQGYDYCFADIYSLGKTMWIILTENKNSHIFTTYSTFNINSKLRIDNVNDGIVMFLERILCASTKENYLDRMTLSDILNNLYIIKNRLLNNDTNCNIVKYRCILEDFSNKSYDGIIISSQEKYTDFFRKISSIGTSLHLIDNDRELCNSFDFSAFSLNIEPNDYYSFHSNGVKFLFKINELIIRDSIVIKTKKLDDPIHTEDSKYFREIDQFSRKSILFNPIDDSTKNIYLECDICLKTRELVD